MSISLFPHNQTAYESLLAVLEADRRACIIHPTGTGKSFIGFKYCEDHPEQSVLWLSPSVYIFKTQQESLLATDAEMPDNITFMTYVKLSQLNQDELSALHPDAIVLDEMHRAAAPTWERPVQTLLSREAEPFVIGLTATSIRYLDGQKDTAAAFHLHVASEMTLGEAIVRGILNPPKYVLSLFKYQNELEKYESRVGQAQSRAVRDKGEELLEALRRALDKAEGMDEIFAKHMPDRAGKYIVFCANAEHMREMLAKAPEWFEKIDRQPHIYSAYSADPETSRAFAAFKADESRHLKLLYCIDMLNEGIHVENVNGVILLRPTISPIVYKQQIGRALSASKTKEPIIFDVVNNIENLYSIDAVREEMQAAMTYYRDLGLDGWIVNDQFKIIDEVRECIALFEQLNETLGASWELMYAEAKRYREQYGDLEVPSRYVAESGYALGQWLVTQRRVYSGKERGSLTDERIELLDKLGMRWESVSDESWNRNYAAAQQYYVTHGDLDISCAYVTEDGIRLGEWIIRLRNYRRSGIRKAYLTEERMKALEQIGMRWDVYDYLFERNFAAAAAYHGVHGMLDVPGNYVDANGVRLGSWIKYLRKMRKKDALRLSEEQIARLDELGMIWEGKTQLAWERAFAAARCYWEQAGNLNIPEQYQTDDGFRLGKWLSRQRDDEERGALSEERKRRLEKIGMVWHGKQQLRWDKAYSAAKAYYEENGNLDIPGVYKTSSGFGLGLWLKMQREYEHAGSLSGDRRRKLEEIGMVWEKKDPWEEKYELLTRYYAEYGHLKMSNRHKYGGIYLSQWLTTQRARLKGKGKPLTPEQRQKLRALGVGVSEKIVQAEHRQADSPAM